MAEKICSQLIQAVASLTQVTRLAGTTLPPVSLLVVQGSVLLSCGCLFSQGAAPGAAAVQDSPGIPRCVYCQDSELSLFPVPLSFQQCLDTAMLPMLLLFSPNEDTASQPPCLVFYMQHPVFLRPRCPGADSRPFGNQLGIDNQINTKIIHKANVSGDQQQENQGRG